MQSRIPMKNMKIVSLFLYSASILHLTFSNLGVNGQFISTPCTSSFITTFTPCFNFITGSSTSGSSSSTKNCCDSLKSFVNNNMDCACLLLTASVPISLPFMSQNLAISLPRICNDDVPIQCRAIGAPLPPPGPALFAPPPSATAPSAEAPSYSASPAPEPIMPTKASKASSLAPASPPDEWISELSPADSPSEPVPPAAHPGIKPVMNHKSASSSPVYMFSPSVLIIIAIIVLKFG